MAVIKTSPLGLPHPGPWAPDSAKFKALRHLRKSSEPGLIGVVFEVPLGTGPGVAELILPMTQAQIGDMHDHLMALLAKAGKLGSATPEKPTDVN